MQTHGLASLGVIVLLAGLMQAAAGVAKVGTWFRAVSPAVIHGMLAGIGALILTGQFHVMIDDEPHGSGLSNLMSIPDAIIKGLTPLDNSPHHLAAWVGIATITIMVLWDKFAPKRLHVLPGPLVGVTAATLAAGMLDLPIAYVSVPTDLTAAFNAPTASAWAGLASPTIWLSAVAVAIIASAETLLCASAVDRMHDGPRTAFNKELFAQGVGNALCGLLGALPMTGVIVRSSANVEAGGKTRRSAILHGAWLLLLVVTAPQVLALIPVSALAAILVFIGAKLLDQKIGGVRAIEALRKNGWPELVTYVATIVGIIAINLLTGVFIGLCLTVLHLLMRLARPRVRLETLDGKTVLRLAGELTFMQLPNLGAVLLTIPTAAQVRLDVERVNSIDHACFEELAAWARIHQSRGGSTGVDWVHLETLRNAHPL